MHVGGGSHAVAPQAHLHKSLQMLTIRRIEEANRDPFLQQTKDQNQPGPNQDPDPAQEGSAPATVACYRVKIVRLLVLIYSK